MVNSLTCKTNEEHFVPRVPTPITTHGVRTNLPLITQLAFIPKVMYSPLETFADYQYEIPVSQYSYLGVHTTVINDPEMIRHCFLDNVSNYAHSNLRQSILKPALREGLLTAEGQQWRKSRKVLAPIFVPKNVESFACKMHGCTKQFINELNTKQAKVTLLSNELSKLTYHIISDTLFSGQISEDTSDLLRSVSYFLDTLGRPDLFDLIQLPIWIPRLSKFRGHSALRKFRKFVAKTIQKRKAIMASDGSVPRDFLTLLLRANEDGEQLTDDEVEDNILTFIAAGHETTARGITWAIYLLSQSPKFLSKVHREIDNFDFEAYSPHEWINHLPWTLACFEESMRLYPPAPILSRTAIKDDHYNQYHIPKGSMVLLIPWMLHRHKTLWDHPDCFNPTRFHGKNREEIDRFSYLPFGAGPRICIGAKFAIQEAVIILALLLKSFHFEYFDKTGPWPEMKITLQPDNGMPMKVTPR